MKTTNDTLISQTYIVAAKDLNDKHTLFGGKILGDMDIAGGMCVMKHTQSRCMTVGVNFMNFYAPLYEEEGYLVESYISGIGNSSIETYCAIYRINHSFEKETLCADGFYTFVPLVKDKHFEPVTASTDEHQAIMDKYQHRRETLKK